MNSDRVVSLFLICLLNCIFVLAKEDKLGGNEGNAYLTEQSVVLITGAAGFLGSELALALHRTYSPKRIICVDRMGDHPESQEELALFEFQRQRSFNVMQTLGDKGRFYRVDFSPMIPEYFDLGEVPVLDHIFRENPDISHVVHLADPFPHSALQVVPREKEVPKAGMMEALLEQLAKHEQERKDKDSVGYVPPHFVYASSFEVYPYQNDNLHNDVENNSSSSTKFRVLEETQTLGTPSSFRGASKMMDEMLAKLYYDTKGIYSVGLRFFTVYGPWGVPGSPLFEMAERAVTGDLDGIDEENDTFNMFPVLNNIDSSSSEEEERNYESAGINYHSWRKSNHDFVYIDDAVDAMMAAMQFRSASHSPSLQPLANKRRNKKPHPIIFNVASGKAYSLEYILNTMQEFFPSKNKKRSSSTTKDTDRPTDELNRGTVGSTKRAENLLGYQPQVSLREGIIKMLAWHYDRAFPYGGREVSKDGGGSDDSSEEKSTVVANQGIVGCLPYDKECLKGFSVFPCASECSHEAQCTKSYYDEVIGWTQSLTAECETVLYTIDMNDSLSSLPSGTSQLQMTTKSFLKGTCNLAFVSQQSQLVQSLQNQKRGSSFIGSSSTSSQRDNLFRDGPWVLIPLKLAPSAAKESSNVSDENEFLNLLPKLSPGLFFGINTKHAIYVDPDILLNNIPKLLREASAQPYSEEIEGATAMLIGRGTPKDYFADIVDEDEEMMLVMDDPNYRQQGLQSKNTLVQNSAYRMVRIAVSDNLFGDGFMELLDSRWIVHTLQSDDGRLFRCDVLGEIVQWEVTTDRSALEFVLGLHDMWSRVIAKASGVGSWWIGDNVVTVPARHTTGRRLLEEVVDVEIVGNGKVMNTDGGDASDNMDSAKKDTVEQEEDSNDQSSTSVVMEERVNKESVDDDELEENSEEPPNSGESDENERGEFVLDAVAQKEVATDKDKLGDSSDEQEDDKLIEKQDGDEEAHVQRDYSSYDTWMGILSSSAVKYFVRIVPSSEVGVISIDRSQRWS